MTHPDLTYRLARLEEILALRHAVLRPGLPSDTAVFQGDHDPATLHVGAFDAHNTCIACASAMRDDLDNQPAYRLRGMATRADHQRRGIGGKLLRFTTHHILQHTDVRLLWCNARVEAAPFYTRHGWRIVSDIFNIPTVGPHYRMMIQLPTTPPIPRG